MNAVALAVGGSSGTFHVAAVSGPVLPTYCDKSDGGGVNFGSGVDGDKTFNGGATLSSRVARRLYRACSLTGRNCRHICLRLLPGCNRPQPLAVCANPTGTHFINRLFPSYNPAAGVYPNWRNVQLLNGATLTVDPWNRDTGEDAVRP